MPLQLPWVTYKITMDLEHLSQDLCEVLWKGGGRQHSPENTGHRIAELRPHKQSQWLLQRKSNGQTKRLLEELVSCLH